MRKIRKVEKEKSSNTLREQGIGLKKKKSFKNFLKDIITEKKCK